MSSAEIAPETLRYRALKGPVRWVFVSFSSIALGISIIGIFHLLIAGWAIMERGYHYILIAAYLPLVFLLFPERARARRDRVPWFDFLAAALACGIAFYFYLYAFDTVASAWEYGAPAFARIGGLVLIALVLEAARRTGGLALLIMCLFFLVFPLVAQSFPGLLQGKQYAFWRVVTLINFGSDGFMGLPMRVIGNLVIGFLIFAVAMIHTGGGRFFLNLALALLGHVRGGPAKVAVVASALFGSLSGSPVSNVLGTGSFTIPAMKSIGYPSHFAGAVEAVASTGGALMPPVMGAAAFIMATFLGVPYATIVVAAVIPSLLYYLGLFIQVDGYAARVGMRGLPRKELPSLWRTLKDGWFYVAVLFVLTWGLIYMRWEARTPYYAIGLLILLTMLRKNTRWNLKKCVGFIEGTGQFMCEITGMLMAIGLIIGGLSITGVGNSLAFGLVELAGVNPVAILLLSFVTAFILGMGMPVTACYVFMAVTVAPALIKFGFDPLASHLFVLYAAMISGITPPVAPTSMVASSIARTSFMKTSLHAMRLGIVIYFIPFFFVLSPSLILRAPPLEILHDLSTVVVGIYLIAGGVGGHLAGVGHIWNFLRPVIIVAGSLLSFPGGLTDLIGLAIAIPTVASLLLTRKLAKKRFIHNNVQL